MEERGAPLERMGKGRGNRKGEGKGDGERGDMGGGEDIRMA